ncbi:MAG: hypothetical protein K9M97_05510, partial [Akkermansiaceae bacterium]|nr:hypothetical protein [Akkermansiaceae bacterium]
MIDINPLKGVFRTLGRLRKGPGILSIPLLLATSSLSAQILPGQTIGIDFGDGPNTPGAGREPNWNVLSGNVTGEAALETSTGSPIPGVTITTSGIEGIMGEFNLGFAAAGVGNYTGTPFSDLSVNDGTYRSPGAVVITIAGLDDALTYDVLAIAAGPIAPPTNYADVTIDGTTLRQLVQEATGSGTNTATPLSFPGVSTDGAGNLVITFNNLDVYYGISALHVTAGGGADSDNDGLPDSYEQQIIDFNSGDAVDGLEDVAGPNNAPATTDFDGDGSSDADEYAKTTGPTDPDSDDDGLLDGVETDTGSFVSASDTGTDPKHDDSDGDGLLDGVETNTGTFNGASNTGTNPHVVDSDTDGWSDGTEVTAGTDPTDDQDHPVSSRITLTDLIEDLDADIGVVESGGNVASWANQTPSGGDDVSPNAGTPTLVAGPNGHHAVRIGQGVKLVGDDPAAFDSLANGGGYTWFIVIDAGTQDQPTNNRVFGTLRNASPWPGVMACVGSNNLASTNTRSDGGDQWSFGTTDVSSGWHIVAGRLGAGTGTVSQALYTDGGVPEHIISSTISPGADSGALTVGAERTGGAEYFDGDVARILIYQRPLSDDELNDTGYALATAYGITHSFVLSGPQPPVIASTSATVVRSESATLNGELISQGNVTTTVWVCWGDDDPGENLALWDNTVDLGAPAVGLLSHPVTGLITDTTCYCRFHAVNSAGVSWSEVQMFAPTLPQLTVASGQALEGGSGLTAMTFEVTLSYPADADITIDYSTVHGSTDNNDFVPASGQITIPAGETSATITVWVNGDADDELDEWFTLRIDQAGGVVVTVSEIQGMILSDDGDHLSPVAVAADTASGLVYIALHTARKIAVVDASSELFLRSIPVPDTPNDLCLNTAGTRLYITAGVADGRVHVIDPTTDTLLASWHVGHTPMAPVLSPDETILYVCNRFNDDVSVVDVTTGNTVARIPVEREPHAAAITPDGSKLYIANLLATGPATSSSIAGHVTVIDTSSRSVTGQIALPTGSHSLRGMCLAPDGGSLYVSHILSRYYVPTTQVTRGWINTNALTVIDPATATRINTILLDDLDEGAANPWGVACSPDGGWLCVAHAGTHEISAINRVAFETKLSATTGDVSTDLTWLAGLRQRLPLGGNGPRGIAIAAGKVFAAEYFSDSLGVTDLPGGGSPVGRERVIGWQKPRDIVRLGEMFYNDATLCLQKWQSCASCHPDTRADGLNWDLLNDGFGNAKNTKSHIASMATPPTTATGIRADGQTSVRAGLRYIQFVNRDESYAVAIDAYLTALQPVPSPHLVNGQLSPEALNGQAHFQTSRCTDCHSGPYFTDLALHEMGTGIGQDAGK